MLSKELCDKIREIVVSLPESEASPFTPLLDDPNSPKNREVLKQFKEYLLRNWSEKKYYLYTLPFSVLPEGWHVEDAIAMQRGVFTEDELDREYNCVWTSNSSGPWSAKLLDHGTDESVPMETIGEKNAEYFMGVDPGYTSSSFSLSILKKVGENTVALVHVYNEEGLDITHQIRLIYSKLNDFWPTRVLTVDIGAGGAGRHLCNMLGEGKDTYGCWGVLGPLLPHPLDSEFRSAADIPAYEDSSASHPRAAHIIHHFTMRNEFVVDVNNRMIADMQSGRFFIAGGYPKGSFKEASDAVFEAILSLKKTMSRIVRKVSGNYIKYDLPGEEGNVSHKHDDWSSLTCAYKGYVLASGYDASLQQHNDLFTLSRWVEF